MEFQFSEYSESKYKLKNKKYDICIRYNNFMFYFTKQFSGFLEEKYGPKIYAKLYYEPLQKKIAMSFSAEKRKDSFFLQQKAPNFFFCCQGFFLENEIFVPPRDTNLGRKNQPKDRYILEKAGKANLDDLYVFFKSEVN